VNYGRVEVVVWKLRKTPFLWVKSRWLLV